MRVAGVGLDDIATFDLYWLLPGAGLQTSRRDRISDRRPAGWH